MPDDVLGLGAQAAEFTKQLEAARGSLRGFARPRAVRDYAQAALALMRCARLCDVASMKASSDRYWDAAEKCRLAVERILAEDEPQK